MKTIQKSIHDEWIKTGLLANLELVSSGVKPFKGTKKYIDTGSMITGKIIDSVDVDFKTRPSRANMEVQEGDVLIAKMKDTEKVYLISKNDEDNLYSSGFAVFRIKDKSKLLPEFIYYMFRTKDFQKKKNKECTGATQKAIKESKFKIFKMLSPTIQIQKKIIPILKNIDTAIELRKDSDVLTNDFQKAIFFEMFGNPLKNEKEWPMYSIREISNKISDGPFGSNLKTEHYTEHGIRVIRLQNIGVEKWIDKDKAYISKKHFKTIEKHTCVPGDVIVGTLGNPNLRACILPTEVGTAVNKADCIQIKPNSELINSQYLCSLLNQRGIIFKALSLLHGQTRTRISMSQVASLEIPVPTLKLQEKYAKIVSKFEIIRKHQTESRESLSEFFDATMYRAFKGELKC